MCVFLNFNWISVLENYFELKIIIYLSYNFGFFFYNISKKLDDLII